MEEFNQTKNYIFIGGGIMAERLYQHLESEKCKLIGVMDTMNPEKRTKKSFREHQIKTLDCFSDEINSGEVAVVLAINAFESFEAINQYLNVYNYPEECLYVPNPYTTLRPCVMNDEFAAEIRIPIYDKRYDVVESLFEDDISKKIFNLLKNSKPYDNKKDSFELIPYSCIKDMYWCSEDYWQTYEFNDVVENDKATVIDCGAYIGDSVIPLCNKIPQKEIYYYAFEPNKENANIIRKNTNFLMLCKEMNVMEYGVGNCDSKMYFELPESKQKDAGRFIDNPKGSEEIALEIKKIDGMNLKLNGDVYIKMDIEGSELSALEGATELIRKYKPYLAICVYHRKNDLIQIPLYLRELVPNYKFYLRGGFHTILWAIPSI